MEYHERHYTDHRYIDQMVSSTFSLRSLSSAWKRRSMSSNSISWLASLLFSPFFPVFPLQAKRQSRQLASASSQNLASCRRNGSHQVVSILLTIISAIIVLMQVGQAAGNTGLSQEAAGELVWSRKGLGVTSRIARTPSNPSASSNSTTKRRVLLGTEEGIIALLVMRTGEAMWRHDLGIVPSSMSSVVPPQVTSYPGVIEDVVMTKKLAISIVSHDHEGGDGILEIKAFVQSTGSLLWQTKRQCEVHHGNVGGLSKSESKVSIKYLMYTSDSQSDHIDSESSREGIAVVCGDSIELIDCIDGSVKWSFKPATTTEIQASTIEVVPELNSVAVATLQTTGNVVTTRVFDAALGKVVNKWKVEYEGLPITSMTLRGNVSRKNSWTLSLARYQRLDVFQLNPDEQPILLRTHNGVKSAVMSTDASILAYIEADKTPAVASIVDMVSGDIVRSISGATIVSSVEDNEAQIAIGGTENDMVFFSVVDGPTADIVHNEQNSINPIEHGIPSSLSVSTYTRTAQKGKDTGKVGYRAIMCTSGGSIALLQQSLVVWLREEALAAVSDVAFVELPGKPLSTEYSIQTSASTQDRVSVASSGTIIDGLHMQYLGLKAHFKIASGPELQKLVHLRRGASGRSLSSRDAKGFRKLLVLGTKTSRVVGLHGGDGRIVWARNIPQLGKSLKIVPWWASQSSVESPELLVVGQSVNGNGMLIWIKAHTGFVIRTQVLHYKIRHIINIPGISGRAYLSIDNDMNVHYIGDDKSFESIHQSSLSQIHVFDADVSLGILRGFSLFHDGSKVLLRENWRQTINPYPVTSDVSSFRIVSVSQHHEEESTFSRSRVMGDRSFRLKYLNKNTALIAIESMLPTSGSTSGYMPQLQVMLIDTITGRLLHSIVHESSRGPVNAVLCENWAVYHFWNEKINRFEISSLEFFTDTEPGEDISIQNMLLKAVFPSANETLVRFSLKLYI